MARKNRNDAGWSSVLAGAFVAAGLAGTGLPALAQDASPPDLIARGKYLATVGDCVACHTASGGEKFAGGQYMPTPFGPISTPNITPDKDTGIGNYTDDDFYRLFHAGIGHGGKYIYPVMPYPWYTQVTRDDALAIKAYLFSLQPVHAPRKPIKMAFPFNVRAGLAVWDSLFLKEGPFKPDPSKSDQINRGAYLVNGLAHCGECHNKRNLLGDSSYALALRGGAISGWYAPNITSDPKEGIGRFSDDQIFTYLKTGAEQSMGVVAGPMSETVHDSLRSMTDDDLHAIVAYLKSTPAEPSYNERKTADATNATNATNSPGAGVYLSNCASCHQVDGKGLAGVVPPLAGNGSVISAGPQNVIRVILGGIEAQDTYAPMPAVGGQMTDQEIADVTNYVRQSWGNAAPANAGPGEVAKLRDDTKTLLNARIPGGCPPIAQPELAKAVADPSVADTLKGITLVNILQGAEAVIPKVKAAAPDAKQADIVNSLMLAYCPVVDQMNGMTQGQKATLLGQFGERVYTQLTSNQKE